jgi:signal transduction histidine kinase
MKVLDNRSFRRITLLIVVSLVVLAGLQLYWVARMYGDMDRRFAEKATAAMERAAYDELTTRNRAPRKIEMITDMMSGGMVMNTLISKVTVLDSLQANITVQNGGDDARVSVITLVTTDKDLSREDFMRYDSLLRLNLVRADITQPYRLSVVSGDGELQSLGDDVAHPRIFDIPIGSRRASVVRLAIENPNRVFMREMAGLISSSVLTVVLLAFTLIYLLRTLFRQKTLEQMRTDFTHNITHELKTPIAVAYAAGDALLNFGADDDPARREKYLRVMQTQLDNLSGMVERILSLSLEDDLRFRKWQVELLPVVRSVVESHELRGIGSFRVDVPEGLAVWADPFQLGIVLSNLVDNAVKYSGLSPEVEIVSDRNDGGVTISVTDNGIGIPAVERERIFEKFYRVPTGNIHNVKGFGLGLYNVRRIVERHGGRVEVASAPGRGSTFTIYFPDDGKED